MHTVVALNVDYAATGPGHLDRAPCRISIASAKTHIIDIVVRVPSLFDPMTMYTALSESDFDAPGVVELETAIEMTKDALAKFTSVILVGHGIARAARVLQLSVGREYQAGADVIEMLRTWNRRFGHWNYYALPKMCHVAGVPVPHNSAERALAMLALYERLVSGPFVASGMKDKLQLMQYSRGFPTEVATKPPPPDGVCVWAYRDDMCQCGQPTLGTKAEGPAVAVCTPQAAQAAQAAQTARAGTEADIEADLEAAYAAPS